MKASIHDILTFAFSDRGGWRVFGDEISAGDGGAIPSIPEIEAHREETEQFLSGLQMQANARSQNLAALREQWKGLPDFIRGPFRDKFEAASRLLDERDDAGAIALINYCDAPSSFTPEQVETFLTVKTTMKSAIENLNQ
jgi:hypothetical protein